MATIIEGALWTLTDPAAKLMEIEGLIKKCDAEHTVLLVDRPIYHLKNNRPEKVGVTTLSSYIADAEKRVEMDRCNIFFKM